MLCAGDDSGMKLLIYSHFFRPSIGGVETVVELLANGLANLRTAEGAAVYEVTVVTNTSAHDDVLPPCFRIIRCPTKAELRELIRRSDLVHVAGVAIPPLREALRLKRPVVVEHHGFQAICPTGQLLQEPEDIPCPGHFMKGNHGKCLRCRKAGSRFASMRLWMLTFFRRYLSKRVNANIVPTAWLGEQLELPRLRVIPHGLRREAAIVRIENNVPRIAFVGRLVTTKGVGLLLEAARILKIQNRRFEIRIIGTGPEREALEKRIKEWGLGGEVKLLGFVPEEEIAMRLADAAVVVVPSLGGEVFGMVVAESMLRGLPVIASDLGAFAEVLNNPAQTFRTGDVEALARQLIRVLDDSRLADRWGRQGRERAVETFTEERMIEGHDRVYREILESKTSKV